MSYKTVIRRRLEDMPADAVEVRFDKRSRMWVGAVETTPAPAAIPAPKTVRSLDVWVPGVAIQMLQLDDPDVRQSLGVTITETRRAGNGERMRVVGPDAAPMLGHLEWCAYSNDTYPANWRAAARKLMQAIKA